MKRGKSRQLIGLLKDGDFNETPPKESQMIYVSDLFPAAVN
jgi:hypothetical protein